MMKIYILHGWAYDTRKWEPVVEHFEKHGIEAVLLKVPGLTAPLHEVWTLEDYVEWLHKTLAKETKPVVLLGHSNGGLISMAYCLRYPTLVRSLILIDSAGVYHRDLKIRVKRYVFGTLAKVGKHVTRSERLRKLLYKVVREHDYEQASVIQRQTMRNLIAVDIVPRLREMRLPVLILWGVDDKVTPLADGKVLQREIPGAVLRVIAGGRHSPQFTHSEAVVKIIRSYIIPNS